MSQSYKFDKEQDEAVLKVKNPIRAAITKIGLQYKLLTEYTSFVAVEERIVTTKGKTQTIRVPVYPAAGTAFEDEEAPQANFKRGSGQGGAMMLNSPANVTNLELTVVPKITVVPKTDPNSPFMPKDNPPPVPKIISGGVVNGRAVNLVQPEYPKAAKAVKASGEVNVEVMIDENGNVSSAKAVSGNPLLKESAEMAAKASKFAPASVSGEKVKVSGVIVYKFEVPKPTPEDLLREKVHFWLFEAFDNKLKNLPPTENELQFMRDGKANIEISLTEKTPEVLAKLKSAGLEISDETNENSITGKISLEKLTQLIEISQVQYIAPKVNE